MTRRRVGYLGSALIVHDEGYLMGTIKSYQEKVQGGIENAISAVENKHGEIADLVYGKVRETNNFFGGKVGEFILKFEKPETKTDKVKKVAKKATTAAKKKVITAKAATVKATISVVEKVEKATA